MQKPDRRRVSKHSNPGYCHVVRSDDGGSFRISFTEAMGVRHVKSSPYNSATNGGAESTVKSIKEYLSKEKIHGKRGRLEGNA